MAVGGESYLDIVRLTFSGPELVAWSDTDQPTFVGMSRGRLAAYTPSDVFGTEPSRSLYEVDFNGSLTALGNFGLTDTNLSWNASSLAMDGSRIITGYIGYGIPGNQLIGSLIFDSNYFPFYADTIVDDAEQDRVWINDGGYNWRRNSGATASWGTGPSSGSDSSEYYYVETSQGVGAYFAGDEAMLRSGSFLPEGRTLQFDTHMLGSDIGQLHVEYRRTQDVDWLPTGLVIDGQDANNLSNEWQTHSLDLDPFNEFNDIQLRFRYVADGGWQGDVGLDNIIISAQ